MLVPTSFILELCVEELYVRCFGMTGMYGQVNFTIHSFVGPKRFITFVPSETINLTPKLHNSRVLFAVSFSSKSKKWLYYLEFNYQHL